MIKKSMQWTCVFTLSALALTAQTSTPVAAPVTHLRTFGMLGLAEGQTARLNLLNPGVLAPGATAEVCSASVAFLDAQGNVLKTGTITANPGQSPNFDVDSDADLKLAVDERREIRATIQEAPLPPSSGSPAVHCRLIPTLEIFDTLTGKTTTVLGHAHELLEPIVPAAN
jgi:hypothetical protein